VGSDSFQVRFEDLLAHPGPTLRKLATHCRLNVPDRLVDAVIKAVDPSASLRFRSHPLAQDFYEQVREREWMKHFGYDRIPLSGPQ
jgi:hypothetical protein